MKTKNLLPLLILGQSFLTVSQVYAQDLNLKPATTNEVHDDVEVKQANSRWSSVTSQLQNAGLVFSNRLGTGGNLKAGIGYGYGTKPSLSGNFLSLDVWKVELGYLTAGGTGAVGSREVTYIEQFNNRRDSVVRSPYNPIARLPRTAEIASQMKEYQFVGYRVPMTVSIGTALSAELSNSIKANVMGKLYSMGEVDVHVYKMADNLVRVRLFALKDRGITASAGVNLFGLSSIAMRVLQIDPITAFLQTSNTDLFSVDYVFNLNKADAREQYDQLMGQKFKFADIPMVKELALTALPIRGVKDLKNVYFGDLDSVQAVVDRDQSKALAERSIIRLRSAKSNTVATTMGIGAKFFKLASFLRTRKDSTTSISVTNFQNLDTNYQLKAVTKEFNYEIATLFGVENKSETGLLGETDAKGNVTEVLGLQARHFKKDLNLKVAELSDFKTRILNSFPSEISKAIVWPQWDPRENIKNASIEQILFFNIPVIQEIPSITFERTQAELRYLITHSGRLYSIPTDSSMSVNDQVDPRLDAFHRGQYENAYEKELTSIPQYLRIVFDKRYSVQERLTYFGYLQNLDLFNEIGSALMFRLIPTDRLADAVNYRLSISGSDSHDNKGELSNFPVELSKQQYINAITGAIAGTTLNSERSFNVRSYIDEKGKSISLDELTRLAK